MRTPGPRLYRVTAATLFILLAVFIALSVDVIVRVWLMRGQLASGAVAAVLLSYESARALTTTIALALGAVSYRKAASTAQRSFTLLLLFLALWYTKAFAFAGFPGHVQEALAEWLFGHGVSRRALIFVFGAPVWAAWLALGALLRVSVTFPVPLDSSTIERSGHRDRAGLLRGMSVAGSDVGALSRKAAAALLRRGAFDAFPVWLLASLAGVLHALSGALAVKTSLAVAFIVLTLLALTNLRAAAMAAPTDEKRRVVWNLQAGMVAAFAFAVSAILSVTGAGAAGFIPLGLAALAPPAVLMSVAFSLSSRPPPDPRPAMRRTLLLGIAALTTAAVFVLSAGMARPLTRPALANLLGTGLALASTALLWSRLRRVAGKISADVVSSS